jgi:hypothetical protein
MTPDVLNKPGDTGLPGSPHPLLDWVARYRWPIFALISLLYIASFNGQWRVGRDSALYRAVARNLADGHGFTFNGKRERHAYPGLPLLLAGVNKIFGDDPLRPIPALLLMIACALAILVVVYRLVLVHFPRWMAVMVTCGLAINWRFLQQTHELMTDLPFTLGVCLALLGFERLRLSKGIRSAAWGIALSSAGLGLAAVMRPTFWFLAGAWALACCWGLWRGPRRWPCAAALSILLLPAIAFIAYDPRTRSASFLAGRYEEDAARAISELNEASWWPRLTTILDSHFTEILFGTEILPGFDTAISLTFIAAGLWLARRVPLWGLLIAITIGSTYLLGSSVPRYYLMILPLILLGWTVAVDAVLRRVAHWRRARIASLAVLFFGFTTISVANVVKDLGLIAQQHGLTSDGRRPFLEVYRNGRMLRVVNMSRVLSQRASPDARILGPEPRIMSYLSGRRVYALSEGLRIAQVKALSRELRGKGNSDRSLLRRIASLLRDNLTFDLAVFPAKAYEAHLDPLARRLIALRIIRTKSGRKLAKSGNWWLGKVSISRDGGGQEFRAPKGVRGRQLRELQRKSKSEERERRKLRRHQRFNLTPFQAFDTVRHVCTDPNAAPGRGRRGCPPRRDAWPASHERNPSRFAC